MSVNKNFAIFDIMNFDAGNDDEFFSNLGKSKHSNTLEELLIEDVPDNNSTPITYPICHQTSESSTNWTTSWAKVANAYKNSYQVGKVGVAILSNLERKQHKIIIYKTKINILGAATVYKNLRKIYNKSKYLQFYDDEENYWSIIFNKQEDESEFKIRLKEIGLCILTEENDSLQTKKETSLRGMTKSVEVETPTFSKQSVLERVTKVGLQLPTVMNKTPMTVQNSNENSDSSNTEYNAYGSIPIKALISPRRPLNLSSPIEEMSNSNGGTSAKVNVLELLNENKAQNSEMLLSLYKLETKVDNVLANLNRLNIHPQDIPNKVDEILQLEEKILILKKENRKLTLKFEESQKMNQAKESGNVLQFFENEFQNIGLVNTTDLNKVIRSLLDKITILETQLKESEDLNKKKSKELLESIQGLHEQNMKVIERHSELEIAINSLEIAMQESKGHNKKLEQELAETKHVSAKKLALQKVETLNMIKSIMNNLNSNISNTIKNIPAMDSSHILALIGKSIREETFKCIHKLNENMENVD